MVTAFIGEALSKLNHGLRAYKTIVTSLQDALTTHTQMSEDRNKRTDDKIAELEAKIDQIVKANKQRFRWVESHWELIDNV